MSLLSVEVLLRQALQRGWLTVAQVAAAEKTLTEEGSTPNSWAKLEEWLLAAGMLDGWQIAQLQAEQLGLEIVDLDACTLDAELRTCLPHALAEQFKLVPLRRSGQVLTMATADPLDFSGPDNVRAQLAWEVEVCVARADQIARALQLIYGPEQSSAPPRKSVDEGDAPVIKLVDRILDEGVRLRASDIHVEPLAARVRIRYRVDGALVERMEAPKELLGAVVSRLKIMSNINIAEHRIPQDGRMQILRDGNSLDLRVSTVPSVHGEDVVLRILDQGDRRLGLDQLGFWSDDRERFEQLVARPNGLLLVTGPTGSGKTTTLYSALQQLNQPERKIITVEEPVEYVLAGINQVPVRAELGMTFAAALRAMLRQAPNVIMVGEIRDRETAEIALHAALTGHMVFSTLHTNDAVGAVARLTNLGVKPFLLSVALRGVLAQRLVRRVCRECRQLHAPTAAELAALKQTPEQLEGATFMRGQGCPACAGTGYRGRLGIFELLDLSDEFSQLIHERAPPARLQARAVGLGMRTMREDGARKAIAGLTTIEEVVSMTADDPR